MPDVSVERGESVDFSDVDVAVAHWHVNAWGGAEYLVTKLADTLGCEQVYTIGAPDPDDPNPFGDVEFVDVTETLSARPLRKLQARIGRVFEYALWEDVDWREFGYPDVLLTSGATTRAVITPQETLHVNYCHSPPRWFYDLYHDRKATAVGLLARPLIRYLRMRDVIVDPRVERYFANSPVVARRIEKYYGRDAMVLHPPVELDAYRTGEDEGFYLHLGRLDEEKGVPAVVDAFAGSEYRLVMAGGKGDVDTEVRERIRNADTIEYRGFVNDAEKYDLLSRCRAVVFNGHNEDFGIVPIEANASGKAALVRDDGFPGLFVDEGVNGYHHDGTPEGITDAVEQFERDSVRDDPVEHAREFGLDSFQRTLRTTLATWLNDHRIG